MPTTFGSTGLNTSLLPPQRCLLHPPSVAQLLPCLANHTVPIHKSSSLESFIVKKIKIKKGEQNTCTYFETSLTFPWCFLAQPLSFLFSALRAPPNLVPPGTKVAPVHRCPHLVVMAPCRTDIVSPQGLYTLLSGSKGAATIPI